MRCSSRRDKWSSRIRGPRACSVSRIEDSSASFPLALPPARACGVYIYISSSARGRLPIKVLVVVPPYFTSDGSFVFVRRRGRPCRRVHRARHCFSRRFRRRPSHAKRYSAWFIPRDLAVYFFFFSFFRFTLPFCSRSLSDGRCEWGKNVNRHWRLFGNNRVSLSLSLSVLSGLCCCRAALEMIY